MLWSLVLLATWTLCLFTFERLFPLRRESASVLVRLTINVSIGLFAYLTAAQSVAPAVQRTLEIDVGLLSILSFAQPIEWIIAFIFLDLSFYVWHRANHAFPLLWRFHHVHHIDSELDISTAARFHFGEILLSTFFQVLQILLIAPPFEAFITYQLLFFAGTAFHHSNIRLPIRLERLLNRFLVTPRMHGIHHSQLERENSRNFSVLFSGWDRLFKTMKLNVRQSAIVIGIPAYEGLKPPTLWRSLVAPFIRQPDYWRRPDGTTVLRDTQDEAAEPSELAD